MKLDLSADQTLLKDTVTRLFRDESTPERIRAAEDTGMDKALWDQLVELGVTVMRMTPPDEGGSTLLDAAIVAEEAGRFLASVPLIEAIAANSLLAGLSAPASIIEAVEGGAIATLALHPVDTTPTQVVPGGSAATLIVARDGTDVVAIQNTAPAERTPNIAASAVSVIDLSSGNAGERIVLASGPAAIAAFSAALEEWRLLTAALLTGLGNKSLTDAAAYSVERVQFGKPIGTFQGIAHPLADSATGIEGARLLTWRAIWAIAAERPEAASMSAMAYWYATQAIEPALRRSLRTYGGYGVSNEYDVQLYYRRAKLVSLIAGDPNVALDTVASRLWDNTETPLPITGDVEIDFGYGESAEAYTTELRQFIADNMTPDVEKKIHHSTSGHHPEFHKKLAQAGHAFPSLSVDGEPTRSDYEVAAAAKIWEDLNWTRTPIGVTEFVAKMCALWSGDEARNEILPKIINGEALGCLGFSEPSSGSDVFGAKFSAVQDGDDWVMNGQKMFTTNAHNAHYILMLTRTDNSGKKHQGLTMFVMPLNEPGVELHPVYTLQDERTNIVYWSDVRIPDKYRIGEIGDGARVMASALGFEHGGSSYHAAQTVMVKHAVNWARTPKSDGQLPIDDTTVRRTIARAAINDEVAESLARCEIWNAAIGNHGAIVGPMSKMFTTETMATDGSAIVAVAAPESLVRGLNRDMDIVETTMRRALAMTIYGGTSEVHRSLIAEKFLGTPKSRG